VIAKQGIFQNVVRVIYIASASHSGSTLLNLMLNAHPKIIAVGELHKLNRHRDRKKARCLCGIPRLWECDFWLNIDQQMKVASGMSLSELDLLTHDDLDQRTAPNAILFRAIAEVSRKQFIVDSSKRPGRLAYLMQLEGVEVLPIHLIRDPKGQICSAMRQNGGFARHVYEYVAINERIRQILKGTRHACIHYEDLVLDPERTLSTVLQPLGLRFDHRQLCWHSHVHHAVAGNHLRWQPTGLVLDQRWKQSLSLAQQAIIGLAAAISGRRIPSRPTLQFQAQQTHFEGPPEP
jgi:hypothetical protein